MKQNKIIIGLIGGSGAGKGMFCTAAKDLDYAIIDGDKIGHEVLQKEAYSDIVNTFGDEVLENGAISRKKLGAIVFNDSAALDKLNKIMHGHIMAKMRTLITDKCVIDAAVLHKTELIKDCTHVIAVVADTKVRIERIIKRDNIDSDAALLRINSQPSDEEYASLADVVLYNNGSEDEFFKKVKECLQGI